MLDWQALYQHSHLPISIAKGFWNWKPSSNLNSRLLGLLLPFTVDSALYRYTQFLKHNSFALSHRRAQNSGEANTVPMWSLQGSGGPTKASGPRAPCPFHMISCHVPLSDTVLWIRHRASLPLFVLPFTQNTLPTSICKNANFPRPWTTAVSRIPASLQESPYSTFHLQQLQGRLECIFWIQITIIFSMLLSFFLKIMKIWKEEYTIYSCDSHSAEYRLAA